MPAQVDTVYRERMGEAQVYRVMYLVGKITEPVFPVNARKSLQLGTTNQ